MLGFSALSETTLSDTGGVLGPPGVIETVLIASAVSAQQTHPSSGSESSSIADSVSAGVAHATQITVSASSEAPGASVLKGFLVPVSQSASGSDVLATIAVQNLYVEDAASGADALSGNARVLSYTSASAVGSDAVAGNPKYVSAVSDAMSASVASIAAGQNFASSVSTTLATSDTVASLGSLFSNVYAAASMHDAVIVQLDAQVSVVGGASMSDILGGRMFWEPVNDRLPVE